VFFRLNVELAQEILRRKGTICFSIFSGAVFGLFRRFAKNPARIRLSILILRQTAPEFRRCLRAMAEDLGFDMTHWRRALADLEAALEELQDVGLVQGFAIDEPSDRITVEINREWSTTWAGGDS
jgi:hypothetical protein